MKKNDRHKLIKKLIRENKIETQEGLSRLLAENGASTTQATLSRDIRELGIIKNRSSSGSFYTLLDGELSPFEGLDQSFRNHVLKVSSVMFMVVIHTRLSEADILANILDESNHEGILGTLAGADTLLVTCASIEDAENLYAEVNRAISYEE
ncbi:arginine repressor [Streptococcaceae bacterium ESL0687]|nr:arginine repressor [Streptococcaceae bacterium ESL0687]